MTLGYERTNVAFSRGIFLSNDPSCCIFDRICTTSIDFRGYNSNDDSLKFTIAWLRCSANRFYCY